MKFCLPANLRYRCAHAGTTGTTGTTPRCQHARATLAPDPVTGEEKQEFCSVMRLDDGACGPDAKLYDAAEPF